MIVGGVLYALLPHLIFSTQALIDCARVAVKFIGFSRSETDSASASQATVLSA